MKLFRAWVCRLGGLFGRERRERELAAEMESHLQLHIDDNLRSGMTAEEARRQAILKLGGIEPAKEAYRERRTVPLIEHALLDLRFALRQLGKNPGFAVIAILVLALGLCASVAIFAFVDAALIKPLPYPNPGGLVWVTESADMFPRANLSYPDYLDWKKLNKVFRSLDVYTGTGYLLNTPSGAQSVPALRVSDGFFRTLGVTPALGRDFRTGEDLAGTPDIVIVSYGAWQKWFGGRKDAIGQKILLSGVPHIVIGVMPQDFQFAARGRIDFWTTLHPGAMNSCDLRRSCHGMDGVARLKDGVSVQTALADMTLIARQLEKQYPDSNRGQGAFVASLAEVIVGDIRPILLVLLGGAALLLLIACVNVASLLLVRSESRKREMAVRSSLGASPARLIGQFVMEALVLVAAGSVPGLAAAHWTMRLLTTLIPADMMAGMPYLAGLGLNWRVLAFAGAISLLAAIVFSATPAVRLPSWDMRSGMAEGSRGSAGTTWRRVGSKLVMLELATAMVLLVGAGLLGKSFYRLLHVEIGFQPDHLATLQVAAPDTIYGKDPQSIALGRRIVERIAALPGVKSVGITSVLPVSYNGNTDWIRFVGRPYNGKHNEVNERDVSSAYFQTLGTKLLRGRYFTDAEDESKPAVVIVNQALARQYFPGQDPIGQQIGDTALSPKSIRQIIGVVDDLREGSLDSEIWPAVYHPFNQDPNTYFNLVVRTSQAEQSIPATLSATVRGIDPNLGTIGEAGMNDLINNSPTAYLHRSSAWLVGGFAGLALLLGVVGLYGVIAYSVSQRTREIGVRMALGAEQRNVYRLILQEAGWLTMGGILAGVVCAVGAASLMRKMLFGVESWDIATLLIVAATLGLASLAASYIPARRAASVNPVDALRAE